MGVDDKRQGASRSLAAVHREIQTRIAPFGTALSTIIKDALDSGQSSGLLQREKEPERLSLLSAPTQHLQETPPLLTACDVPLAPLSITCFGHFAVRRSGKPITLCSNRCGQRILRYLISQPGCHATSDMLQRM